MAVMNVIIVKALS